MRWYRIAVPPGCVAVVPPSLPGRFRMMLNGERLQVHGDAPIDIHTMLHGEGNTLAVVAPQDNPLVAPLVFVTGPTPLSLQSWTGTGLANFSGTAVYTKTFTLPDSFRGQPLMLDLGRVSSVAEVYINGASAGTLVWSPYRLDITKFVQPGTNQIRIVVTNTEANRRAVGTWHHILPAIDVDGMEGPAQIIPWVDQVLTLRQQPNSVSTSVPQ
jgi:hypothetical protein